MLPIVLCVVRNMSNRAAVVIDLPNCVACGKPHEKADIQKMLMPIYSDGEIFNWGYYCAQHDLETAQMNKAIIQVLITDEEIEKYWPDGFL